VSCKNHYRTLTQVGADRQPAQADLLERVCAGATIPADELRPALAAATSAKSRRKKAADAPGQKTLLD